MAPILPCLPQEAHLLAPKWPEQTSTMLTVSATETQTGTSLCRLNGSCSRGCCRRCMRPQRIHHPPGTPAPRFALTQLPC